MYFFNLSKIIFFDDLLIKKYHDIINIKNAIKIEEKIIDIHESILIINPTENTNKEVKSITITAKKIGFKKNVFLRFIM